MRLHIEEPASILSHQRITISMPQSFEERLTKALLQPSEDHPEVRIGSRSTLESLVTHTSILHEADVVHFAKVGFDASVGTLAKQLGFQGDVVKTVYSHLTTYEQTVQVMESMQQAAEERAVAEISSRNEESDDEESVKEESSDEESVKEESVYQESMKEESGCEQHKDIKEE
ncbi:uncharacterized protein HD556DRAFT_1437266 [Suillus plorans]|uniref:Uncharacterized protein n=1 Tax=Suillus plorans TaxID=116603 RepID=A0A9P7DWV2_9AGAM|nr:uncharacterized protein HD556DRAFT_1437266 [Suillus plorans]KAG1805103.1 hypothetical protein HD556DRAFT_1437266 [Suillus plorans]